MNSEDRSHFYFTSQSNSSAFGACFPLHVSSSIPAFEHGFHKESHRAEARNYQAFSIDNYSTESNQYILIVSAQKKKKGPSSASCPFFNASQLLPAVVNHPFEDSPMIAEYQNKFNSAIVETLLDMDARSQSSLEHLINVVGQNQYDRGVITTDPATSIIPNRSSSLLFTATSAGGANRCGISAAGRESRLQPCTAGKPPLCRT